MASRAQSAGSMIAFAVDRTAGAGGEGTTRRDVFARALLEYALLPAKARRTVAERIAGMPGTPRQLRTSGRTGPTPFDLSAVCEDGSLLGITARVDSPVDDEHLWRLLAALPDGTDSRLVLITPRASRPEVQIADERLVTVSWDRLGRRLAKLDPKRADLWELIGAFGEDAGPLAVRQPASPRILLDESLTAEMQAHLSTFCLVAEELVGRAPRLRASRTHSTRLQVGMGPGRLGAEFGQIEDGTPTWLSGTQPARAFALGIGALEDDEARDRAVRRLRGITGGNSWRTDPAYEPSLGEFIGTTASEELEDARALVWDALDPRRLAEAGFPAVAHRQVDVTPERLALRVAYPADPHAGTFLVSIGGSRTWKTLLPRVTREHDDKTYIVQAGKKDTAQDLVTAVHTALRSLATKP